MHKNPQYVPALPTIIDDEHVADTATSNRYYDVLCECKDYRVKVREAVVEHNFQDPTRVTTVSLFGITGKLKDVVQFERAIRTPADELSLTLLKQLDQLVKLDGVVVVSVGAADFKSTNCVIRHYLIACSSTAVFSVAAPAAMTWRQFVASLTPAQRDGMLDSLLSWQLDDLGGKESVGFATPTLDAPTRLHDIYARKSGHSIVPQLTAPSDS